LIEESPSEWRWKIETPPFPHRLAVIRTLTVIDGDNMSVSSKVSEHYRSGDPSQLTPMEIALSRCSWCLSASEDEADQLEDDSTAVAWMDEPHRAIGEAIDQQLSSLETDHQQLNISFEEETDSAISELTAID